MEDKNSLYMKDLPKNDTDLFVLDAYPLLDKNEGLRTVGSEAALRDLLNIMNSEALPGDIGQLQAAYVLKDWEKVQQLAHKIKGGAVYVGTIRLKMACQYLERYWKLGKRALLEQLYQQVLVVDRETRKEITKFLKEEH